jgi:hypothetical protein
MRLGMSDIGSDTRWRSIASSVLVVALPLTIAAVLVSGCEHAKGHQRALEQTACRFTRSPGAGMDIRNLRISGGETCPRANRLVLVLEAETETPCGPAPGCHVLGFTCVYGGGRLARGGGYAYADVHCARGRERAAWRSCVASILLKDGRSVSGCSPAAWARSA